MSQNVKYIKTGHEGVVSDAVALILEKKGEVKILGDAKAETKKAEKK